jgi:putative DNA primase/helicase
MLDSTQSRLSAVDVARLDSYMIDIAAEARGTPIADDQGNFRFGTNRSALVVFANQQFHDFSGGEREHGFSALELIAHLYPNQDPVVLARDWLARHPGQGGFQSKESADAPDDFAEIAASAYVQTLYKHTAPIEDTAGQIYLNRTRGLPLRPEDQAQLRWIPEFRGDEGALIAPVTDDNGQLVKLLVIYVTPDGLKSPHTPCRISIRGARRGRLCRFGTPGPKAVETESVEKALAARAAGPEYVVVTGGVSNLGRAPLPTIVSDVVIARDDDPPGSPADLSLWRGVTRRLSQGLKVTVTARPNEIAPKGAPFLKDVDDLYRCDADLVPILLNGANLEHGRLGDAVDNAILDTLSRLDPVAVSRARKSVAQLLGIHLGALDDKVAEIIKKRIEDHKDDPVAPPGMEPWPDPVTDFGAVLDDQVAILRKLIAAPHTHHDAIALWSALTHVLLPVEFGVRYAPRLACQSKVENSGKTTAMSTLLYTAARAKGTTSLSGASIYRETDAHHWTILWDEADMAFHRNTAPELIGVFDGGHDRKFAVIHRQVPTPDGGMETKAFDTFTGIALTALKAFPSRAMQGRCIALIMQRASKAEAAQLEDMDENHEAALEECGRKAMRWAADLRALPKINKADYGLINRIWLNWRPLLQIAQLAGGTWPARALAAARADMKRVQAEKDDSDDYALLAALWRVFARDKSIPRRMYTREIVQKLLQEDEGRWRTVGRNGREINDHYIAKMVKDWLPTEGDYAKPESRRWRPASDPKANPSRGYSELHFENAFTRYLGLKLPSQVTPEAADMVGEFSDFPDNLSPDESSSSRGGSPGKKSGTAGTDGLSHGNSEDIPAPDSDHQSGTVPDQSHAHLARDGSVPDESKAVRHGAGPDEKSGTEITQSSPSLNPSVPGVPDQRGGDPPPKKKESSKTGKPKETIDLAAFKGLAKGRGPRVSTAQPEEEQ